MASSSLASFPEELLERILEHSLITSHASPFSQSRPKWLRSPSHSATHLAPLHVSHRWNRISTPLLYHAISLPTPVRARLLLATLKERPELRGFVREVAVGGVWKEAGELLWMCRHIQTLELTICFDDEDTGDDMFGQALEGLRKVQHLTVHKPSNVYLSLPRPRAIINSLSRAINNWPELRTAHVAFKLSDDTPASPASTAPFLFSPFALPPSPQLSHISITTTATIGPISHLTTALANAPKLHTFTTHLPSVWNTAILAVAANPKLQRIALLPNAGPGSCVSPIVPTGLFLTEARRHTRLAELIGAGTPIIRSRAQTLGTQVSPYSSPASSASSSRSTSPNAARARTVSTYGADSKCGPEEAAEPGMSTRQSGVGLGLKLDTNVGRGGPAPNSSPICYVRSRSPVSAVNPSWMGSPLRSPTKKGKRRF